MTMGPLLSVFYARFRLISRKLRYCETNFFNVSFVFRSYEMESLMESSITQFIEAFVVVLRI